MVRPVRLVREAGVDDVQQRFVGREREPVRLHEIRGHDGDAPARRVDAVDVAGADFARRGVAFVVRVDAVARVGEPDAAVALDHDVVGRIEALAVVAVGQHRALAVELGARHAAAPVLARDETALRRRPCCRCCSSTAAGTPTPSHRFRPSAACGRSGCRTRRDSAPPRTTPAPRPSGSRCRASRRGCREARACESAGRRLRNWT